MAGLPSSSSSSSSLGSGQDTSEEKTNGTRLARLLIDEGSNVLRTFLHSVYRPEALANELKKNLAKFQGLKSKRVIFDDQWGKLFPPSGDPPDSKTFDITLLHLLIREVCNLPAPLTGWHKMPVDDDKSLEANITRIKCFRNELCHSASTGISNDEFEDKWTRIASSLEAIEIDVHLKKIRGCIQGLKNAPIDHKTCELIENQVQQWQKIQQQEEVISKVESYLPHTPTQVCVRSQELRQVIKYVESGTVALVRVTGGPGFGKTTLAKAVARELAKSENERSVLFCRLLSKKTFNEAVIEMIHSCGKSYAQPPEHPDQWLMDWSKQIQMQVTFVLDNADDVLESEERNSFLRILTEMRQSSQKVTFVITSREQFKTPDLPSEDVELSSLTSEQAKEVLISQVNDEEVRKNLSTTEKIVKLCGYVPLALSIVASLLSDYTEEMLVEHLEKEPMKLLDDGNESVETAIKTSFDLLSKDKQDALILMSIFPGSFKSNAAVAVISKACSESRTLPVSVLRALKKSSLIEQPSPRRYQLHPLIRAFGKGIGHAADGQVLLGAEKLACAHFISLLVRNAKIFWSKDTCKASMELFSEDRHNFEYFLQVYAKSMENHDQDIVDSCKTFQADFLQNCMYVEKCVTPSYYTSFLEALLKSFSEPTIQPVRAAELFCLRGHEKRKVGDKGNDYQEDIQNAYKLFRENSDKFDANTMSGVYVLNSYADFLSKRGDRAKNEEIKRISEDALELCQRFKLNHPETAETILLAGRFAKRMKSSLEAQENLEKSLKLFREILGTHPNTVHALKEIGDLFFSRSTVENLEKALTYYKTALEMMEQLGMENNIANINMMKIYGNCNRKAQNYEEGKKYLDRAYFVAERELQPDHMWKVMINISLALLNEETGKKEEAIARMQEALEMCDRLKKSFKYMGRNSEEVLAFLRRHEKAFPRSKFPR